MIKFKPDISSVEPDPTLSWLDCLTPSPAATSSDDGNVKFLLQSSVGIDRHNAILAAVLRLWDEVFVPKREACALVAGQCTVGFLKLIFLIHFIFEVFLPNVIWVKVSLFRKKVKMIFYEIVELLPE